MAWISRRSPPLEAKVGGDRAICRWTAATGTEAIDDDPDEGIGDTVFERAAVARSTNSAYLKISRRVRRINLPAISAIFSSIAIGEVPPFLTAINVENKENKDNKNDEGDKEIDEWISLIRAFDFRNSQSDNIFGHRLNLLGELALVLIRAAKLAGRESLRELAKISDMDLENARDDARNIMNSTIDFYEGTKWVYGVQAFGLRFAAWMFARASKDLKIVFVLAVAAMRRRWSNKILSSQLKDAAIVAKAFARIPCNSRRCGKLISDSKKSFHQGACDGQCRKDIDTIRLSTKLRPLKSHEQVVLRRSRFSRCFSCCAERLG